MTKRVGWIHFSIVIGASLVIAIFLCVISSAAFIYDRANKRADAAAHGKLCLLLIDPDVGPNSTVAKLEPRLARVDPEGDAYLRSHGASVTLMDISTIATCTRENNFFPELLSTQTRSSVNSTALPDNDQRVVALAHELVHVQHGDPATPDGQHTFFRHLWISEEGEAHLKDVQIAKRLGVHPIIPIWKEYLCFIYVEPILYCLAVLLVVWIQLGIRIEKCIHRGKDASPSLAPAAAGR
jgi:hypothetical protein